MKIAQLTPGSGDNFYCENCQRDVSLVRAMRSRGHDMLMIPMYLPLQADKTGEVANAPIFFGGINVYLQQKLGLFRKTPRWVDKLFDSRRLLEMVSRRAMMVEAKELGETTLSMLEGENGRQVKELDRLVNWLALPENRPDAVCLSNLLLVGLVRRLKERLGVPVLCLLQDEDEFLDQLTEEYAQRVWDTLRERSREVDTFIAVSEYYRRFMQERLNLPDSKFETVYIGIDHNRYPLRSGRAPVRTLGYLSRMCRGKGLDILSEAFIALKKRPGFEDLRLTIAGGMAGDDMQYVDDIKRRLERAQVHHHVEFHSNPEHEKKLEFLHGLSVMCGPERRPPAYGLYVLESFAAGVPVVVPETGVFPELVSRDGGGGWLYSPNTPEALADKLAEVLCSEEMHIDIGSRGRAEVEGRFSVDTTARRLEEVYRTVTQNGGTAAGRKDEQS